MNSLSLNIFKSKEDEVLEAMLLLNTSHGLVKQGLLASVQG